MNEHWRKFWHLWLIDPVKEAVELYFRPVVWLWRKARGKT